MVSVNVLLFVVPHAIHVTNPNPNPNPNPKPKPKPNPNQVRGRIGTEWGLRTGPLHSSQAGPTPEPDPYP